MIKALRIDFRLLHGQVVFSWVNYLGVNHIIVANDHANKDAIQKMALMMAKPPGSKLDIVSCEEAIEIIKKAEEDVFVIVGNTKDARELASSLDEVRVINFGNIAKKEGSSQYGKALYLNAEELEDVKKLKEMNVQMEVRQLPNDKIEVLNAVID